MRACIHIGTQKTGTSSIQDFLAANRGLLLSEQGCLYPACIMHAQLSRERGFHDHNQLAIHLRAPRPGDVLGALRREIETSGCRSLIISAEAMSTELTDPELVARLRQFLQQLGCDEVRIVVWLRESGAMFASLCSQWLRTGLANPVHLQAPQDNPIFCFMLDYRSLLQRFGQVFGRQALRVRLFERECWPQGELLRDAAAAFELAWDERFVLPAPSNERLNLLEMEVLRRVNPRARGAVFTPGSPKAALFGPLHRHLGALQDPQLRFVPPQAVTAAWRQWAAEGNEWVRQEFFPERKSLFAPPPQEEEHYELSVMKPQWWEALGRTLAELSGEVAALRRELGRQRTSSLPMGAHADTAPPPRHGRP